MLDVRFKMQNIVLTLRSSRAHSSHLFFRCMYLTNKNNVVTTQVFCCIAIVGIAIIYFIGLWIRQVFTWPRRDRSVSDLPAPPRACTGNGSLPVYGHTRLFFRLAGDVALLFQPEWREWHFIPHYCNMSRPLGECFAIFIWGRWRVVIKGPERAKTVMDAMELKEGWPWTPPVTLLGKSCFAFLQEEESEQMRCLIERPLDHRIALLHAPQFAELAEKCLDESVRGVFKKSKKKDKTATSASAAMSVMDEGFNSDIDDDTAASLTNGEMVAKIKWDALRSYTVDLVDGPILNMNKWVRPAEQNKGESSREGDEQVVVDPEDEEEKCLQPREKMLLWMDRMKSALGVIKITFGPEWMHIWRCNEYGRALNARTHIEKILQSHVSKMSDAVPVKHARGHFYQEPSTRVIPLLGLRDNFMRNMEGILGGPQLKPITAPRHRTQSLATIKDDECEPSVYVKAFDIEQDLARPNYESSPKRAKAGKVLKAPTESQESPSRKSFQDEIAKSKLQAEAPAPPLAAKKEKVKVISVLERLLRQQDLGGNGLSQVVLTEISILLWMMMDAGNAWTAMALNLLSTDTEACGLVQTEIDCLVMKHGQASLFTPCVLGKMVYLDALLYEAIRLCPAFLGGMKTTTTTVELKETGVQIPKNSDVIFCQPTDMRFNIHQALGRKPEGLGRMYPCVEL